MSHQPERKEKNCLNCGSDVNGRYCQRCGQENIVTHQPFWALTKHFIYDVLHFDGKFFDTLRFLLTRPGYVPAEYVKGRRNSYLDPIRMYLFTSAVFFLVFFTLATEPQLDGLDTPYLTRQQRLQEASRTARLLKEKQDSALASKLVYLLDTSYSIRTDSHDSGISRFEVTVGNRQYLGVVHKDSVEADVNSGVQWLDNTIAGRWKRYKAAHGDDLGAVLTAGFSKFFHRFPVILFISLPFFALILKLLYRRRKQFFYSDHAVFTLYQYILTFILLLFFFGLNRLAHLTHVRLFTTIGTLVFLSGGVFLYLGMRRFYAQSAGKTLIKFLALNVLALLLMLVLMAIFLIISFFQL